MAPDCPEGGAPKGGQTSSRQGEEGGGRKNAADCHQGPDVVFAGDDMHWHR